jgi:hypothetical protein
VGVQAGLTNQPGRQSQKPRGLDVVVAGHRTESMTFVGATNGSR